MPLLWTPPYATIPVGSIRQAAIVERVASHKAAARTLITDPTMPGGSYAVGVGGSYSDWYYAVENGLHLIDLPDFLTTQELRTALDWALSKQITNGTTTYTRPQSGGTDTYPLGTWPDMWRWDGTDQVNIIWGDKPSLAACSTMVGIAWAYGRSRAWDATWIEWWNTYRQRFADGYLLQPYNDATDLICQWTGDYHGGTGACFDGWEMAGDLIYPSILGYMACRQFAEMEHRAGNTADVQAWTDRAAALQAGIRAQFITDSRAPMWTYLHINWDRYPAQTGTPEGWTAGPVSGEIRVVADPQDATRRALRLTIASGSEAPSVTLSLTRPCYAQAWTLIRQRAMVGQTNKAWAILALGKAGTGLTVYLSWGADGNVKYYTGSTWSDLPTTTAYAANIWYEFELRKNDTTHQIEVLVDGVSKGSVPFIVAGATTIDSIAYYSAAINVGDIGVSWTGDLWLGDPATGVSTDPIGWLPAATDPEDRFPDIRNSGLAAWMGILTPEQVAAVGRYGVLLWKQPDKSGTGEGIYWSRADAIHGRGLERDLPWSEDSRPEIRAYNKRWTNRSQDWMTYGQMQNGGYWGQYGHLMWAMYQADRDAGIEILSQRIDDSVTLGSQYPGEWVGAPYGSALSWSAASLQYIQSATADARSAGIAANPLSIKTIDGNPLNVYSLVNGEWTPF